MIFNQTKTVEDALALPTGRVAADVGFLVEQSVSPDKVLEAAQALLESGEEFTVASQAGVMVKAQELGVAFQSWGKLQIF